MTTRLRGLTVLFEQDIREDDAERIVAAIRCLRNVLDVMPIEAGIDSMLAERRAKHELLLKLRDVLRSDAG
jgi:hypothetical protein